MKRSFCITALVAALFAFVACAPDSKPVKAGGVSGDSPTDSSFVSPDGSVKPDGTTAPKAQ